MKLARPQLNLTRPKVKRPQLNIEAPQVVTDVARDLRDRRLLIPAIALAVALVAVPLLLSRSQETPPPPAAPPADVALKGAATQPAVLTEEVSVRDYKERLDQLKSKNPFQQHFTGIDVGKDAGLGEIEGVPVTETSAGGGTASTGLTTGAAGGVTSVSTTPSSTGPPTSTGSSSSGNSGGSSNPDTVTRYVTHRVDVSVGAAGSLEQRDGIDQLKLLPSNSSPVLVFLGTSEDGKRAIFLVSDDVAATGGDGKCLPSPSSCTYLVMREGDEQTFDYTPDGLTYKLKVRAIRTIKLKNAPGVSVP
jgi:hypothetical protein